METHAMREDAVPPPQAPVLVMLYRWRLQPGGSPATWRSSPRSSRAFCPVCGSSIGAIDDDPVIALLLGSFDSAGRKQLAAVSHSYVSARPRWWHVHSDGEVQR